MRLRVVSYNIHKGRSATGTRESLTALRLGLYNLRPDLLFLQEVQGRNERRSNLDGQHESLAAVLNMQVAYGCNAVRAVHLRSEQQRFRPRVRRRRRARREPVVDDRPDRNAVHVLPDPRRLGLVRRQLQLDAWRDEHRALIAARFHAVPPLSRNGFR